MSTQLVSDGCEVITSEAILKIVDNAKDYGVRPSNGQNLAEALLMKSGGGWNKLDPTAAKAKIQRIVEGLLGEGKLRRLNTSGAVAIPRDSVRKVTCRGGKRPTYQAAYSGPTNQ